MKTTAKISLSILAIASLMPMAVLAMTSETYRINSDVIGASGDLGSSASYKLTDTLGEPVIGIGSSANYSVQAGFWHSISTSITLQVDSSAVNLGALLAGIPNSGQSVLTVTTDAWGGYDLYAQEDHQMRHTDATTTIENYACAISAPCLWSGTGAGFSVIAGTGVDSKWGTNPNYKYADIPASQTLIHTKVGYTSGGNNTTIQYKVDVPSTQKSGNYSHLVTYTAMAKL